MQSVFSWQVWAGLSAFFAALTVILAKLGVENINSNFATLIRTAFVLLLALAVVSAARQWQPLNSISARSFLFLALSRLRQAPPALCYFRRAPNRRCRQGRPDR